MHEQDELNYFRIAKAIEYIRYNFRDQPNLDQVASSVHLSPFHFQRIFKEWAGTTPKKFLQYISVSHAKKLLTEQNSNIRDTAFETGLSSCSRLHDLFINLEAMTPAEYQNGGKNLTINYNSAESPFGKLLIAATAKGICYMAFEDDTINGFSKLNQQYPNAVLRNISDQYQENAKSFFRFDQNQLPEIKLHLKGSNFQLKVWEALLKIPSGRLSTYGSIAEQIGKPTASRAVGTAIGSNPVAYLIPCHRVIQSSGKMGGYMWGETRKAAIIGWEAAMCNQVDSVYSD